MRRWRLFLCFALGACAHAAAGPSGGAAELSGRVTGPDGRPAAGVVVAANRLGAEPDPVTAETGPDGRYRIAGLAPGGYGVTATSERFAAVFQGGVQVQGPRRLDLRLGPEVPPVAGRVTADDGAPLEGLRVLIGRVSQDDGDAFVPVVRGDRYAAALAPDHTYFLHAQARGRDPGDRPLPAGGQADLQLALPLDRQPPPPPEVLAWIKAHATPLRAEPGSDLGDLEPLGAVVGQARVVTLGDASHGSRELYQVKHRVFQFLAERRGFTTLALEAGWADLLDADLYVRTGQGDPGAALARSRFYSVDTEEVLALLQWMRAYNADPRHPRKLGLAGVDMQYPAPAARLARDFLARADPALRAELGPALEPLASEYRAAHLGRDPAALAPLREALGRLEAALDARRAALEARTSPAELRRARQAARVAAQAVGWRAGKLGRDRAMADNVGWLLASEPGARVAVWAHNGHAANEPEGPNLGAELARDLPGQVVHLGSAFNRGAYVAFPDPGPLLDPQDVAPLQAFTYPAAPPGTLDATLAAAGPALLLPFRELAADPAAAAWFGRAHGTHDVGGVVEPDVLKPRVAPRLWEALLFFDEVGPTRVRPTSEHRPAPPRLPAPADLDFEAEGDGPWQLAAQTRTGYLGRRVAEGCHAGQGCAELSLDAPGPVPGFGTVRQRVEAGPYAGKRVRLRAQVRADAPGSLVRLWAEAGSSVVEPTAFADRAPAARGAWEELSLELDVPPQAAQLAFGLALEGPGRAWLDDVRLEVVAPR